MVAASTQRQDHLAAYRGQGMATTVMEMSHTAFAGVRAQRRRCNNTATHPREAEPNSLIWTTATRRSSSCR